MKLWVHALLWLPVAGVCAVSCGDDPNKVVKQGGGGEGGTAMQPSAGGSDAPPSKAGEGGGGPAPTNGGVPGEAGMPPMVSAGAGGMAELGGAGGEPGLSCAAVVVGGAGGDPYGGGEWRDFTAGECKACPGTMLSCQDLLNPVFDPGTAAITLQIAPGMTELVSATLDYYYYVGVESFGNALAPAVIEENDVTITFDDLDGENLNYLRGELRVVDGCGDEYSTRDTNNYDFYIDRIENAGGAPSVSFEVTCNND